MKTNLSLIFISIYLIACCPNNQQYPVPDKLKYISYDFGSYNTYVVNDSLSEGYKFIKTDSSKLDLLTSYYNKYFEKERIETIDFQDSFKVAVGITSYGKVVKILHSHYSPIYGEIDFLGTLSNSYVSLNIYSLHNASINFVMNSYKKQGQSDLTENVFATSLYLSQSSSIPIKDFIRFENLKNNDTIYSSYLNLKYQSY
ncbi:MAG TPA: hypothetical protein VK590_06290 [Saprospiraceae bacterium]|nr:hypothetical protein [Saprospiraceae bacterium]